MNERATKSNVSDVANMLSKTIEDMKTVKRPFMIISLNNPVRAFWDTLIICCLVYIFFIVPLEVAFDEPSSTGWKLLGRLVDIIFWADIAICFRTTYYDNNGEEIWNPLKVAKNYLKDFFFIDLVCSLPGYPFSIVIEEYLIQGGGDEATLLKLGKAPRVLKVVRTLKFVKVFRVMKIARKIQDIKDTVRGLGTFVKMLKLLVLTTFFLHINACLFSFIASFDDRESWVLSNRLIDEHWGEKYLNALYWSATTSTTVGYGDFVPVNQSEKIFCIVSMCVGVCLYGYIIGSMTEMVTSTSYVDNKVQQQLDEIHEFIRRHHLPRNLVRHVLTFFRHHFKRKKMIDERRIMEMLPQELLRRCQEAILKDTDLALFKMIDSKHFPVVMELLLPRSYSEGEVIVPATETVNEPILEFYVLLEGCVDIFAFGSDELETSKGHEARVAEQIPTIQEMYEQFGIEDDSMTHKQLEEMLTALLGYQPTKVQVANTMLEIDDDGSGTIEVEEFVEWFVTKKIEGPLGCGVLRKRLEPVTLFGSYTGFGIGGSNVTYVAHNDCDVYTVSTERLMHEFSPYVEVMKLIEHCLIEPARRWGPLVDVDGPDKEERRERLATYHEERRRVDMSRATKLRKRFSKHIPALQKKAAKANGRSSSGQKTESSTKGDTFLSNIASAFIVNSLEKKIANSEQRILEAVTKKLMDIRGKSRNESKEAPMDDERVCS